MGYLFRTPAIVRRKQPYVDWANSAGENMPDLTLELARRECSIYLLPQTDGGLVSTEELLSDDWEVIFDEELDAWAVNQENWPADRTREMFDAWFDVEFAASVMDLTPNEPLTDLDRDREDLLFALETCAECGAQLEQGQGRFTGFKVESLGEYEDRIGLTVSVPVDEEYDVYGLIPPENDPARATGDIVFRVCSAKCEKLIRKKAKPALREIGLSPLAD